MKTLNAKASKILSTLLAMYQTVIDNSDGIYMPVHIEVLNKVGRFRFISLAHYGHQNGDSMRDPEMIIIHDTLTGQFIPSNFENDYAGIKSNSATVRDGRLIVFNEKIQADHTHFANGWLESIAEQQEINI